MSESDEEVLLRSRSDGIVTLRFNRPDSLNAMTLELLVPTASTR